jgi:hypothetical protein
MLLYNTFRVLGPAFEASSGTNNESFGTNEHLNRYSSPPSGEKQRSFDEKVEEYRHPTPSYRSPTRDGFSHTSPQSSIRPLLPTHQERSASVQSFYSYPSSPSIGRSITPVAELNRTIGTPEPNVQRLSSSTARTLNDHIRQGSTDSLGLPAPPRRTRSPVIHQPSRERVLPQVRMVDGAWTPVDPQISRQVSNQTFGRPNSGTVRTSTSSALSVELGSSSWHSRNGSLPSNGGSNKPVGSAFGSAFSASNPGSPLSPIRPLPTLPRHSRSLSAVPMISPAPAGRQRAVLVSRSGSISGATHTRASSSQAQVYYA